MNLSNDRPIESKEADEFGWAFYAKKVADTLMSVNATNSTFVAALQGPWGSGKTSFLHLVESEMKVLDKREKVNVAWFNPWFFQNEKDLLVSLFQLLLDETGLAGKKKAKDIVSKFGDYTLAVAGEGNDLVSAALTALSLINPAAGVIGSAGGALAKQALAERKDGKNPQNLVKLKAELDKGLSKLDHKLVVFIDDLDRLSSAEICLLFKTVTLTASFPQIVYVLAFDRAVVSHALEDVQGFDGNAYLEKIIQLPIDVPSIERKSVNDKINTWSSNLYKGSSFRMTEDERDRFESVARGLLVPWLKTPRQFARFENALAMKSQQVGNEVCPIDLLGMTAIQLFMPEVFEWVKRNASFLCGGEQSDSSLSEDDCRERQAELENLLMPYATPGVSAVEGIQVLFPRLAHGGNSFWTTGALRSEKSKGRVCCPDLFRHFLGYELPASLSRSWFMAVVVGAQGEKLQRILNDEREHGDMASLLCVLEENIDFINENRACQLVKELAPFLGKCGREFVDFSGLSGFDDAFGRLIARFAHEFGPERLTECFVSTLEEADWENFLGLAPILRREARGRMGDASKCWMVDDGFRRFAEWYIDFARTNSDGLLASGLFGPLGAWRDAERVLDGETYRQFLEGLRGDTGKKVLYEACGLCRWSNGAETGFSASDSKASTLDVDIEDVRACMESSTFTSLAPEAQVRVAGLGLLLDEGKGDSPEDGVTREAALERANVARANLGAGPLEMPD